jgi:hypothetical protein
VGRILCRLGFHKEVRRKSPGAEGFYGHCTRCGRDRDIRGKVVH